MNMPKRASCHHFMRRKRSASSAGAAGFVWLCVGSANVSGTESRGRADDGRPAAVIREPVPMIQSRREVRCVGIRSVLVLRILAPARAAQTGGGEVDARR